MKERNKNGRERAYLREGHTSAPPGNRRWLRRLFSRICIRMSRPACGARADIRRARTYFPCIYGRSFAPTRDRSTRFSVTSVELGNDLARGDKTAAITLLESRYATRS